MSKCVLLHYYYYSYNCRWWCQIYNSKLLVVCKLRYDSETNVTLWTILFIIRKRLKRVLPFFFCENSYYSLYRKGRTIHRFSTKTRGWNSDSSTCDVRRRDIISPFTTCDAELDQDHTFTQYIYLLNYPNFSPVDFPP